MNTYACRLIISCLFTFLMRAGSAQQLYVFSIIGPNEHYRPDRERLYRMADSLTFYGGYRQIRYDFSTQGAFTASSVRKTLMTFQPENADKDLIWLYYAGRGYGDKPGAWPTLRIGKCELAMREVLAILRSKTARTLLVTIDCASQPNQGELSDTVSAQNRIPVSQISVRPRLIRKNTINHPDTLLTARYRQLIQPARIRQIIIMAAADYGQRSYRTNKRGSIWLETFSQVIHSATYRPDTTTPWKQLQEQLSHLTQLKTGNRQTPKYNRQTITCCETDSLH